MDFFSVLLCVIRRLPARSSRSLAVPVVRLNSSRRPAGARKAALHSDAARCRTERRARREEQANDTAPKFVREAEICLIRATWRNPPSQRVALSPLPRPAQTTKRLFSPPGIDVHQQSSRAVGTFITSTASVQVADDVGPDARRSQAVTLASPRRCFRSPPPFRAHQRPISVPWGRRGDSIWLGHGHHHRHDVRCANLWRNKRSRKEKVALVGASSPQVHRP